jgi:proteasome lid subunit RPN8/RPN11
MIVFFLRKLLNEIQTQITNNPDHEIGGILFGQFNDENVHFESFNKLDAISSHQHEVILSSVNAQNIIFEYFNDMHALKPIVGLWHNHLSEDNCLSEIDIETGRQWAKYLSSTIILAIFYKGGDLPNLFLLNDLGETIEIKIKTYE